MISRKIAEFPHSQGLSIHRMHTVTTSKEKRPWIRNCKVWILVFLQTFSESRHSKGLESNAVWHLA